MKATFDFARGLVAARFADRFESALAFDLRMMHEAIRQGCSAEAAHRAREACRRGIRLAWYVAAYRAESECLPSEVRA